MINIKVFSDYIWPFCYVGEGVIKKLESEYNLDVEWIGMEIHPETPEEGVDLNKRFGKDRLKAVLQSLNKAGKSYDIKFGKLENMPNSHNSLEASEYARSVGKFDAFNEMLMKAYFTDNYDIGSVEVLLELGEACGLNKEDLRSAIINKSFEDKLKEGVKLAQKYGVTSTPTFIINDKHTIVGAQSIDVFRKILDGKNVF